MRVLLAYEDDDAGAPVVDVLMNAGVEVTRCHDPERPALPCKGLSTPSACPLDGAPIDAVIASSSDDHPHTRGTLCALRQFVPLVLVGDAARSPLTPFASAFASQGSDVIDAVDAAVAAPLPRHDLAARTTFREVLDGQGLFDVRASAHVTRAGRGLRVRLGPSEPIPSHVAELACVRVVGALRDFDTSSPSLSVGVDLEPGPV